MTGLLISWALVALGLWIADRLIPEFEIAGDWPSYALVAAVVGVINFLLGRIIYGILGVVSLGLGFLFSTVTRVIATAIVLKLASGLSRRFNIDGFMPAVWAAIVLAVTSGLGDVLLRR